MTTDPALIERMEKLVRDISDGTPRSTAQDKQFAEARAIASLLPDKDMGLAHEIAQRVYFKAMRPIRLSDLEDAALAGIKCGRANPS